MVVQTNNVNQVFHAVQEFNHQTITQTIQTTIFHPLPKNGIEQTGSEAAMHPLDAKEGGWQVSSGI
jgi:hypothetical protein